MASRMIGEAVRDGFMTRSTSTRDARRAVLMLTDAATEFLEVSRAHQRQAFETLVGHWAKEDQERFAAYPNRLATGVLG